MWCTVKIPWQFSSICRTEIQVKANVPLSCPLEIIPVMWKSIFPSPGVIHDELSTPVKMTEWRQQDSLGCLSGTQSPSAGTESLQHILANIMSSLLWYQLDSQKPQRQLPQLVEDMRCWAPRLVHFFHCLETSVGKWLIKPLFCLRLLFCLHIFRHFREEAERFLCDILLPNLVWHAGRTAAAARTSALSCLLALLHGGAITPGQVHTNTHRNYIFTKAHMTHSCCISTCAIGTHKHWKRLPDMKGLQYYKLLICSLQKRFLLTQL